MNKVHIVTVSTDSKFYFPYLKATCSKFGASVTVLGFGQKWGGYVWKFKQMIEFLNSIPKTDIVCFVDGYDVVCTRDLSQLGSEFLKIKERVGCDIIIAKDYDMPRILTPVLQLYFGTCQKTRLNSGTYIGLAGDLLTILSEATASHPNEMDDQKLITCYCKLNPSKFYIDVDCKFFYVSLLPMTELSFPKGGETPFFVHAAGCGYLTNVLTGMGYDVDPTIKKDLKRYFIKKEYGHVATFFQRYILFILIFIIGCVLVKRWYSRAETPVARI